MTTNKELNLQNAMINLNLVLINAIETGQPQTWVDAIELVIADYRERQEEAKPRTAMDNISYGNTSLRLSRKVDAILTERENIELKYKAKLISSTYYTYKNHSFDRRLRLVNKELERLSEYTWDDTARFWFAPATA